MMLADLWFQLFAPRGLPRNCYDQEWYDNLRPFQQRRLERLEEDFDFGIHADEL